jgi:hypothetical protein
MSLNPSCAYPSIAYTTYTLPPEVTPPFKNLVHINPPSVLKGKRSRRAKW